jgi:hypothetical protein
MGNEDLSPCINAKAVVLHDRPYMVCQLQGHGRTSASQRPVRPYPVVHIPPQRQGPGQTLFPPRPAATATRQASLLAPHRTIESLDMRGVDLVANAQPPNALADLSEPTVQGPVPDPEQMALGVANLLDHPNQQARRRFQVRLAPPPAPVSSPAMSDPPKDLQDRGPIRHVIVHQEQGHRPVPAGQGHRGHQLLGHLQRLRAYPQVQHEAAHRDQDDVHPRPAHRPTRSSHLGTPFLGHRC